MIIPYHDFSVECPQCGFSCRARIFNGVENWSCAPALDDLAKPDEIVSVIKTSNGFAQHALACLFNDGPHAADYCVIWASDQATFDLLVKLAENYHTLGTLGDDNGEDDEGGTHRKTH